MIWGNSVGNSGMGDLAMGDARAGKPAVGASAAEQAGFGSTLLATPFDTIATMLEHRARKEPEAAAMLLAAACWCEMIRDDTVAARRLAAAATTAIHSARPGEAVGHRVLPRVISALVGVVEAMGGRSPFDHERLEDLTDFLTSGEGSLAGVAERRQAREISWVLEVPNWMTFADRYADAARLIVDRLADMRPSSDPAELIALNCFLSELEFRRGRWENARESALLAIELARRLGDDAGYAHVLAARIEVGRGQHAVAEEHIRSAWSLALKRGDRSTQWRVAGVEAFAACSAEEWEQARSLLRPLADQTPEHGVRLASVRLWDGDYIEALVRGGENDDAARHVNRLEIENDAVPTRWTLGLLQRSAALLEGDDAARLEAAQNSVSTFTTIGAIFEASRSQLVLAERLMASGRTGEALAVLRAAELTFSSLGAERWLARAAEIQRIGRAAPANRTLPKAFDVLTKQELELVNVVGRGATNKESAALLHVSVKTVEAYLTSIFRKLQLRSRSELVAIYCGAVFQPGAITPWSGPSPH